MVRDIFHLIRLQLDLLLTISTELVNLRTLKLFPTPEHPDFLSSEYDRNHASIGLLTFTSRDDKPLQTHGLLHRHDIWC